MEWTADPSALAATLLEASPDGLLLVDADGVIRLANRQCGELFGWSTDELCGTSVDQLVPSEQRLRHAALRDRYSQDPARRPMGGDLRLFAEHADGSLFPVEISLSPVTIDDEVCTIATVRDVSDRQETTARLALFKERERIAWDIHDMVIQRLFAAGMSLQAVEGLIESPIARDRLAAVTKDLDGTIRRLRDAIFHLGNDRTRSTLSTRASAVVHARSRHLGSAPELSIRGSIDDLDEEIGDELVATLTEALANVADHARATEVAVEIERTANAVRLRVRDNGIGPEQGPTPGGGLSNVIRRVAELGGSCSVAPGDAYGTVLDWTVPLTDSGGR